MAEQTQTMTQTYNMLVEAVAGLDADFTKFSKKSNKSAGSRVRMTLLSVKKLSDSLRKQILAQQKAIPKKEKLPGTLKLVRESTSPPNSPVETTVEKNE